MPTSHPRLPLGAEYHDGAVESVHIGPRRQVELVVRLDPVWNDGDGATRRLRFSKIENFEEVEAFFRRLPPREVPDAALDTVSRIVQPAKGVIGVELVNLGYVELRGAGWGEG